MMLHSRRPILLFAVLFAIAGLFAACDQSGMDGPESMTYTAPLSALNSSGVSGQATVTVQGNQLTVAVDAQGAEAERVHAQHIHGFESESSGCPTAAADTSSVSEGAPSYGGILVPLDGSLDDAEGLGDLETFPTGNGSYAYERSIMTGELDVNDDRSFDDLRLDDHAIVVHGRTVDGEYKATLPVACGTLSRQ